MNAEISTARELLHRLLHSPETRAAFVATGPAGIDAPDSLHSALESIDHRQLTATADAIASGLIHRKHRGSPGLAASYSKSLESANLTAPDAFKEVVRRFVGSVPFANYREIPTAEGKGLCIEEAFFLFLEEAKLGDSETRRNEFWTALFRALALQPDPNFRIPLAVQRTWRGYRYVAATAEGPRLYAAVDGRFLTGVLTPLLANVLATNGARHPNGPQGWDECAQRLQTMGVLDG